MKMVVFHVIESEKSKDHSNREVHISVGAGTQSPLEVGWQKEMH